MSDEWEDYESGPYCRHWDEYGVCGDPCRCGHTCGEHDGDGCRFEGCPCPSFEDAP